MKKLVLFNGPRHSGKDTAALYCEQEFGAYHFKFSAPIKAAIKAMFNLTDEEVDYLESIKTEPTSLLMGMSYVGAQISFSEDWVKKILGKDAFGRLAATEIENSIAENPFKKLYVSSDSGFSSEAEPVVNLFGKENTLLVRIFRDGKDFSGDSRSYISINGVTTVPVINSGSVESYHKTIHQIVSKWCQN